jgi:hippurate hydrolase
VVTIGFMRGGTAYNVIPDEVHIGGTVRSFKPQTQDLVERRMGEIIQGTAAACGATAEFDYRRGYPPTVNHADEAMFAADVAAEICGDDKVNRTVLPSLGGEDFSYMLQARPGAYVFLGQGGPQGGCFLHNPNYDFNDEVIPLGAGYLAALVEEALPIK